MDVDSNIKWRKSGNTLKMQVDIHETETALIECQRNNVLTLLFLHNLFHDEMLDTVQN